MQLFNFLMLSRVSILRNWLYYFFPIALSFFMLAACKEKRPPRIIDRSFYYWKSSFNPGIFEQTVLADLNVKRLYVKLFDVGWNESKSEPMPLAIISFPQNFQQLTFQVIPAVFITNDCMVKINEAQIKELAQSILLLIKNTSAAGKLNKTQEIQLDCDWTESTRDKYFLLLKTIKHSLAVENIKLSSTVRLYQYKYSRKAGIPPVDRGLLMCYNMGNLKNPDTKNSILDVAELESYVDGSISYPLPLDVALPVFGWKVLFRNNLYSGLIKELATDSLKNSSSVKQSGNKFQIIRSIVIGGYKFEPGDLIRNEEVTFDDLVKSENVLTRHLKTRHLSVVLYHLDSITLSKFSTYELETVFDHLR